MDLQMPAPDGFAATAQIRRFEREHGRRRVPVVAYTSATVSVGHPRLRDSGIDAVLRKPADAQSFRECVTRWCLQEPYPLRQRAAQTHAPMALHLCGLALAAVVALLSAAPAAFAADKAAPMSAKDACSMTVRCVHASRIRAWRRNALAKRAPSTPARSRRTPTRTPRS